MGREHSPKPGADWGRELVRAERYALDVPVPSEGAQAMANQLADDAPPVGLNREQRRALKRARRRKGGRRG